MLTTTSTAGSIDLAVTGAVLTAAVLHTVWDALAHTIPDQLVGFVLIGLTYTGCSALLVPFSPFSAGGSWPFLLTSVVLHAVYSLLLMQSYRVGEFNQVYPLARGTSPLVVAAVAVLLVGEHLSLLQPLGVLVVSAGLGQPGPGRRPAAA